MSDSHETPAEPPKFDFSAYPEDTLFYDRRTGLEGRRREPAPAARPAGERREKKERRKRIDPTTFEKQYTPDEIEFMTAMQEFKIRTGKSFPTYAEVLKVAKTLGYQRLVPAEPIDGDAREYAADELYDDGAALPVSASFAAVTAGERTS